MFSISKEKKEEQRRKKEKRSYLNPIWQETPQKSENSPQHSENKPLIEVSTSNLKHITFLKLFIYLLLPHNTKLLLLPEQLEQEHSENASLQRAVCSKIFCVHKQMN